jgi:hypothetical protein
VRAELQASHAAFHALLRSLSEADARRPSLNPGWNNGEILAHMIFGYMIVEALLPAERFWRRLPPGASRGFARLLNAATGPFNWFNALGARLQGRIFTLDRAGAILDRYYSALLRQLDSIRPKEWQRGMYYPQRWDPNFDEFMTLEKVLRYPARHFDFHLHQIARSEDSRSSN